MTKDFVTLEAEGIAVTLDLAVGHIRKLVVTREGREISSLARAPWIGETLARDTPPHLARLSGDFFCAPFGASDIGGVPAHGWSANAPWRHLETSRAEDRVIGRFELSRDILGARVIKEFVLRDGHPFLYQRHVFEGGSGALPVGQHLMLDLGAGANLSFSARRFAETPTTALEPDLDKGRSRLAYPARFEDLTRAPTSDGSFADLTNYPFAELHEDFVMLVETPEPKLSWSAALRTHERDITLSLKTPSDFPMTLLWMSNGGRFYPPWSGRHRGVLGLEEARTHSLYGRLASIEPNPLSGDGVPTAIVLSSEGVVELRQITGLLPAPEDWARVADLGVHSGHLVVVSSSGGSFETPFDEPFLNISQRATAAVVGAPGRKA